MTGVLCCRAREVHGVRGARSHSPGLKEGMCCCDGGDGFEYWRTVIHLMEVRQDWMPARLTDQTMVLVLWLKCGMAIDELDQ